mmetsp:Transcript_114357/g.296128  ORF Transcript_114357/g.296128 Transcript_114357/m.296128 type:complete len:214 (+) Transcript_114357:1631-2272(+)
MYASCHSASLPEKPDNFAKRWSSPLQRKVSLSMSRAAKTASMIFGRGHALPNLERPLAVDVCTLLPQTAVRKSSCRWRSACACATVEGKGWSPATRSGRLPARAGGPLAPATGSLGTSPSLSLKTIPTTALLGKAVSLGSGASSQNPASLSSSLAAASPGFGSGSVARGREAEPAGLADVVTWRGLAWGRAPAAADAVGHNFLKMPSSSLSSQ